MTGCKHISDISYYVFMQNSILSIDDYESKLVMNSEKYLKFSKS